MSAAHISGTPTASTPSSCALSTRPGDSRSTVERIAQTVIMFLIGIAAGAGSFTHVHDVAATHGQAGWLAWADAVVLELMSIASGLELRRRKQAHASVAFPAAVLATAVVLSLGAQVVDAEPSPIGWIAAAVPALGFLVMVKIALGHADLTPRADSRLQTSSACDVPGDPVVQMLVPAARSAATTLHSQGRRLTRHGLAEVMRADGHAVSNGRASALLMIVKAERNDDRSAPVPRPSPSAGRAEPARAHA